MRNSKIIICQKVKLDRDYNNVLDYTEAQMLEMCNKLEHLLYTGNNISIITGNTISVQVPFQSVNNANYIAYQNPDYQNKWFFAFITNIRYISNNTTEIDFEIDAWATWFSNWQAEPCFVIRQHVNDDEVGKHTLPENLESGEYIIDNYIRFDGFDEMCYIIQATEPMDDEDIAVGATNFGRSALSW